MDDNIGILEEFGMLIKSGHDFLDALNTIEELHPEYSREELKDIYDEGE